MPLSVAAACSSKLNERQKRLRSANPHARLMRAPNGACRISCIPPPSSKNRSATMRLCGRHDAEDRFAGAHVRDRPVLRRRDRARTLRSSNACAAASSRSSIAARSAETSRESSIVRPRPSPFQNGIVGGAPCASSTRTTPVFDAPDPPRRRAEQEDVAGHALDREVFVERSDGVSVGFGDDLDSSPYPGIAPPRRDRGHPRAAPPRSTPLTRS